MVITFLADIWLISKTKVPKPVLILNTKSLYEESTDSIQFFRDQKVIPEKNWDIPTVSTRQAHPQQVKWLIFICLGWVKVNSLPPFL